jgi:PAS domain S-box-containing protein
MKLLNRLILFFISGICFFSSAPASEFTFDHVVDLGVPGGQTFVQDNDGFLWIGSDGGGLFRYDGYELKNYGPGEGLSNGTVWRIVEDRRNPDIFWIGTSGGLNRFDKSREIFTHYRHDPGNPQSLGDNTIQDMVQDSRNPGILWLGTSGGGLNRFDTESGNVQRFVHDPQAPGSIGYSDIRRLIEDRTHPHILWIGTWGGGLDRFDKQNETFSHYVHDPQNPNSLSSKTNTIDALIQDRDTPCLLWIGTPEDGLDRFDTCSGMFRNYPLSGTNGEAALILDDGKGRLWLGGYVMNNGLTLFDKQTGSGVNYKNNPSDPGSLGDNRVVHVYEDKAGIFWITTGSGKIEKVDPHTPRFILHPYQPDIPGSMSRSAAGVIYQDRSGDIWIGTQAGLNRFDRKNKTPVRYFHNPENPDNNLDTAYVLGMPVGPASSRLSGRSDSTDTDYILGMLEDSSGNFWVSLRGLLTKLDRETGKVLAMYPADAGGFTRIIEDPDNPLLLWMGTHTAGLAKFDQGSGTFTFYPPVSGNPGKGPASSYVQSILHDTKEDVIWLGGYWGGGLNRFDKQSETFTHYLSDPQNPKSISSDALSTLYQDAAGSLWIGTKGGGLNRFDKNTQTFTRFTGNGTLEDAPDLRGFGNLGGLVPPEVNGVLEDDRGRLWLSTNKGIVEFNPQTGTVERHFTQRDGLQGNAFLHGSALKTREGEMWFGGRRGAVSFYPRKLTSNPYAPPVVLTALTQGGAAVDWGGGRVPSRLNEIRLDWRKNFFEFEFGVLNYTVPHKNQARYILEGFDKNWYHTGTMRSGRYSNLPGGEYTLRIMGANNDGVWGAAGVSLKVSVASPFWQTLWFKILLLVLGGGVATGIHRFRLRVIEDRKKSLEIQIADRTAEIEFQKEKLKKNERFLEKILDAIQDGISVLDKEQNILRVNRQMEIWYAHRMPVVGKKCFQAFHAQSQHCDECPSVRAIETGQLHMAEVLRQGPDGEDRWFERYAFPMKDSSGNLTGIVEYIRNITLRKQAEMSLKESQLFNQRMMQATPDIIYVYDIQENKLVFVNHRITDFLGYSPEEIMESGPGFLDRVLHPTDLAELNVYSKKRRELSSDEEILSIHCRMKSRTGQWLWFRLRETLFQRDSSGQVKLIIATAQDITEQKQMHENLKQAKKDAEAANVAKSEFLARMSHEIRTPMNAVIGLTHLTLMTELTEQQTHYLNRIQSSARILLGIINDILDFSKIEAGKLALQSIEFNMDEVLESISDLMRNEAEKKGIELLFSVDGNAPSLLIGDSLRLEQILINLIGNAIKFTEKGQVRVRVQLLSKTREQVKLKFSVHDTGIGVEPEKQAVLFTPFTQADGSMTRKFGGTGLGLAICKRLVGMMDGQIGMESQPGKGSIFFFTASFGWQAQTRDNTPALPENMAGMRILVADDHIVSRMILEKQIDLLSFESVSVTSGPEAVSELERASKDRPYPLVLLDWSMPGMDGIETARRIQEHPGIDPKPRIIMVTAYGEKIMDKIGDVHIDAMIFKPVHHFLLSEAILKALGRTPGHRDAASKARKKCDGDLSRLNGVRILLVEDNRINRMVARELLEKQGMKVHEAVNGLEGLQKAFESDIDVILMDIEMPEMNGYEAVRQIREREKSPGMKSRTPLPIIAMTAHVLSGEKDNCLKAGMNDYISKPFDPKNLLSVILKWVTKEMGSEKDECSESIKEISEESTGQTGEKETSFLQNSLRLYGIDAAAGLSRVGGNEELYRKLIKNFCADYADAAAILRETLKNGDTPEAVRLAHTLKGIAGHMGARSLYTAANELEFGIKNHTIKDEEALLNRFESAFNQVVNVMTGLNECAASSFHPADAPPLRSGFAGKMPAAHLQKDENTDALSLRVSPEIINGLNLLAALLKQGDTEAEERLRDLKNYLKDAPVERELRNLEGQMDRYDFDEARKTVEEIAQLLGVVIT